MHDAYNGRRFRRTKITHKASDTAENLQLYWVVRFFRPRSSCTTMHESAEVQRITLMHRAWWSRVEEPNNSQTNKSHLFVSVACTARFPWYILPRHWLYEWFSQFHSRGTYSVLSQRFHPPSQHIFHPIIIIVLQNIKFSPRNSLTVLTAIFHVDLG